jgi:mRNA interferase MazF
VSKPFHLWNENKILINDFGTQRLYHARDVWWCSVGINIGYEQDGTGKEYQRPIVILKGFSKQVCLMIPLTTSNKSNPYYIPVGIVDHKQASAIISQIRLIDTRRLINKIGVLDTETFEKIKKAIKGFF